MRSAVPLESKTQISAERKHAAALSVIDIMFLIQEYGLNPRNFKHFQATPIRSDFNGCHGKDLPLLGGAQWKKK
jgi:hypothetical protein